MFSLHLLDLAVSTPVVTVVRRADGVTVIADRHATVAAIAATLLLCLDAAERLVACAFLDRTRPFGGALVAALGAGTPPGHFPDTSGASTLDGRAVPSTEAGRPQTPALQ